MVTAKLSVGTDVIEIKRFRNKPLNDDNASFYHSIFTESELTYCMKYSDPYPHIAGMFAAKESIIKCISRPLKMIDIQITHDQHGKPIAVVHFRKKKAIKARISISHTSSLAIAMAITNF
jgi:phosphopantetheine--protein transferase-like protein